MNKESINEEVVRHIAALSRLSLSDTDVKKYQSQLKNILDYIEQLDEVNTEDIPPTTHVLSSMKNVFREDVAKDSLSQEEVLDNAPSRRNGFFRVPKVI